MMPGVGASQATGAPMDKQRRLLDQFLMGHRLLTRLLVIWRAEDCDVGDRVGEEQFRPDRPFVAKLAEQVLQCLVPVAADA